MTGDADPKTDGLIKYVWTVEHRQLIYGDVLFDMSIDSSDAAVLAGYVVVMMVVVVIWYVCQ